MQGRVWCQVDYLAIWVVPALGFMAFLDNFVLMHFGCTASEVRHLLLDVTLSMAL